MAKIYPQPGRYHRAPPRPMSRPMSRQTGGTFLGFVLGLIVALSIAVVVALYITRSPTPFVAKSGAGGDTSASASIAPVSQFDPNRILQGKSPGQAVSAAPENTAPPADAKPAAQSGMFKEPQIVEVPAATPAPATNATPTGAHALSTAPVVPAPPPKTQAAQAAPTPTVPGVSSATDANTGFYLQIGAYKTSQDAQQQRAKLALQGFESNVTQRDSGGVTFYRVRIGPFAKFDDMNNSRQQLSNAGIDAAVIRFTKQ
jgi:cell division protein FtsN